MTEQDGRHFGENPDLVEQYVLDRLDPALREKVDAHLRDCAECRKAVDIEKGIAAGVRTLARDEMKKRLARRVVTLPPARAVPWPRIAAVAALLAVVVGIGLFGNWFNWRNSGTGVPQGEIAEQRTPLTANESSDKGGPTLSGQVREAEAAPAPAAKSRMEAADSKVNNDRGRKDITVPQAVSGRAAEDRAAAAARHQFWATGTISNEPDGGAAAVQATEEADRLQLEKKAERDKGEPNYPVGASRVSAPPPQAIVLDQRSPATLPPAQQALHYQSRTKTIQSLIEERTDTLRVTLFPDSPIEKNELQKARAERIGEDSLVITVEGQQIGFRLPPELRQTRKTK